MQVWAAKWTLRECQRSSFCSQKPHLQNSACRPRSSIKESHGVGVWGMNLVLSLEMRIVWNYSMRHGYTFSSVFLSTLNFSTHSCPRDPQVGWSASAIGLLFLFVDCRAAQSQSTPTHLGSFSCNPHFVGEICDFPSIYWYWVLLNDIPHLLLLCEESAMLIDLYGNVN